MKVSTIKAQWEVHLQTPMVPNFFIENAPAASTDEANLGKYPICDFPDHVLRKVGEAWTEALIARAAQMRLHRTKA